jgi:hypothetical protein
MQELQELQELQKTPKNAVILSEAKNPSSI